ncbi:DUF952 domain-containing protein [Pimelobacter simplex]|uniref:Glutathione S-transferase domain protein n=1 Tax=Nocardioides simplex TaxID=2045 RepID=A0A0C5XAM8_NOCSI|nr:DUF952 domain-containing protein [Pimelobacter simplex]AJR18335.1 Glutathione S-transferase domain protein [Pimelobacter simplex]MCG8151776.1 DUF952 domain-containing protein [Pimelobacter simplex]GEB13048.1 hypothetical protein NSI01_13630 [Pimelobacter simplex]SFM50151.1 Uncharacterized conserved protein, DUF952 family [Pimelobacter simplex]
MATIFHLALASEWAAAQQTGAYTTSTLGRTLADEGFIHASRADQWTGVRDRFYADVTEPLVLLHIDTDLLDVPVVDEPPAPGMTETFPHIYGRLPVSAVVKAIPLSPATPTKATPPAPQESFSRIYFREMFFNLAIATLALAASVLGLALGLAIGGDRAPGIGGLVGLVAGIVAAAVLYRRRHARTTPERPQP